MASRTLIAAVVIVLAAPAAAEAHVKVVPTRIVPGQATLLTFTAPNERLDGSIAALEVTFPPGLVLAEVEQKPGWRDSVSGSTVTWSGGRITPRHFATFAVIATTVATSGTLTFASREIFDNGRTVAYRPALEVGAASADATAGRDSSARTLGKAALFVALAAGVLAFGAFFIALAGWIRGPRNGGSG